MINMNAVTIESAEQKDYASWLPLWINYQTFYRTIISDEVTKLTWERFFTPSEPVYCAVAKYDGKIVGLVHYLFHRSTWAESNYCYLEDLFVSEDVRGQDIGKQLIEYVQQQAKKHHASRLYWHTHETNLRGQRLYDWVAKKSGMIEYRM
ncbi:GNAT family N-acetyltransferase [Citrobacter freundii]|uniref:GNAT family N-acetyltransferase n=1 Tax=Citrobacter freundii TaxID=546 RepID=UPI00174EBA9F|nr:GNAT family N-acetyltransferase [Citrobacter freundii]MBD5692199.1 GNAT family N-acetyltransferase [Citrobacter freundii]